MKLNLLALVASIGWVSVWCCAIVPLEQKIIDDSTSAGQKPYRVMMCEWGDLASVDKTYGLERVGYTNESPDYRLKAEGQEIRAEKTHWPLTTAPR